MEATLNSQRWSRQVVIRMDLPMFNFFITIIFASAMFILGDAVGIDGLIEICNKIVSLFQ